MNAQLLEKTEAALLCIAPLARQGWPPALSLERQLLWCRALALDLPREPLPGPFSMGLIATRELDMWGHDPELAALIQEAERLAEAILASSTA